MSVFLLKSVLSIFILLSALFAMFTMFEVFGRAEKKYDVEKLKKFHRANGRVYFVLYAVIAYFCLRYLVDTKVEPSPRASLHSALALTAIVLLAVKVSFVRFYRQFYAQAKTIGIIIALISIVMVGISGGYYLLITKFGAEEPFKRAAAPAVEKEEVAALAPAIEDGDMERGRELYESKCYLCHDPESNDTIVGPGHKGILTNPLLPVSKRPATPENVARQMRTPYAKMPSFDYLSDEEEADIIAYLKTL